jgi:hypothetical protein
MLLLGTPMLLRLLTLVETVWRIQTAWLKLMAGTVSETYRDTLWVIACVATGRS